MAGRTTIAIAHSLERDSREPTPLSDEKDVAELDRMMS